jgi:hypothetical protein
MSSGRSHDHKGERFGDVAPGLAVWLGGAARAVRAYECYNIGGGWALA